jgi:predicted ATPase/DNA-binding SARP family transcriptional activator
VGGSELAVELLGPVRVRVGGATVDVGGPKQQAVLAVLALAAGQQVAPGALAQALWGDEVPASAGGTLRAYVSRLRALLPEGVVQRGAVGWTLDIARCEVDVLRAQTLLREAGGADTAAERSLLAQALQLWRGDPLTGLTGVPFARAEADRLRDVLASARERLLELRLAAGEARDVVAEAQQLVRACPLREPAVAVLAVALSRSGRQAEALEAVDQLRRRLADELGLEPSPATVDLHRRLLLHDPSVAAVPATAGSSGPAVPLVEQQPRPAGRDLPLPLTSFVGRDDDIATVHQALEGARLVTLTGPAGAGKTRLALESLRRSGREDLDGPWLVELAHVTEAGRVADSVAQALGVATPTTVTPHLIADAVRGRRLLLVLDNCEHVVDVVADLVTSLLSSCGGLQVLATSREPLGVPGERLVDVAPLRQGRPGAPGEAERLFVERAASVVPGFRLDAATAPAVSRLVRSLDGLPLAVELAAARLTLLSLDDMVEMLDDRFALLEGGSRTAPPQQRTLAAAVRWSHDLLDDEERRMFGIASTFAGPFDLAALRGIAEPELGRPVIGLLASLTAKSMVQVDSATGPAQRRSYRLLETMRAFARDGLDPALRARLADRHATWYAQEADRARLGLRGPEMGGWLARLDASRPDLRAALGHAVMRGDRDRALRLVAGLAPYWFHRGHVREGLDWVEAALALPGYAGDEVELGAALGAALLAYVAGDAARDGDAVLAVLFDALRSAPGADESTAAVARVYAGYFQATFGDLSGAFDHFARADALLRSGRVLPWAAAEVLFAQGQLLRAQGQALPALTTLAQSARTAEECGHAWARGSARWIAAKVHLDLRQGAPALALLARELPSCLELGIHTSTLTLLHTAAAATAVAERHGDGALLLGAVDAWSERLGYSPLKMDPLDAAAHAALVAEGLSGRELAELTARGRELSLPEAVRRVVATAQQMVPVPVPRDSSGPGRQAGTPGQGPRSATSPG